MQATKPIIHQGTIFFPIPKKVGELYEGARFRKPANPRSTFTVTGVDYSNGEIIAKNTRGDIHRFNETHPVIYLSPTF